MASNALTTALAPVDPAAVEQTRPVGPVGLLNSPAMLEQITESLPQGMDAATFKRHAITLVKQTPKLMECEATSVAQGIVRGAALGLDPDPALGQMYLVPRRVKVTEAGRDQWIEVATFQVGYRGLYELAMRTGRIAKIEVKAVHRNDYFEAKLGTHGGLEHRPDWFGDRGPVIGWYAYAQLKDGTEMFEVLSIADAEAHRDSFAPRKRDGNVYGPWVDHFAAMASKTVFIKLAKWLPKSVELARGLDDDNKAYRHPLGGEIHPGDVIEATQHVEPRPELTAVATVEVDDEPGKEAIAETEAAMAEHIEMTSLPLADENGDPVVAAPAGDSWGKRNAKAQAMVPKAWPDSDAAERTKRRKGLVKLASGGRTDSSRDLTDDEWTEFFDSLELIVGGSMVLHLRSNGGYELRRAPGGAS